MRTRRFTAAAALAAVTWASAVCADPIIKFPDGAAWSAAISGGFITGLNQADSRYASNTNILDKIFPGQQVGYRDTSVSATAGSPNGLISNFGTSADKDQSTIGAWCWTGPDPDFSGTTFEMDLFLSQVGAGEGFDQASFSLLDTGGLVKSWGWDVTRLSAASNKFTFKLSEGAGAGGSDPSLFYVDPGFDIHKVLLFQGSFRGTLTDTYTPIVPGSDGLDTDTRSILMTPEGDSLFLFSAGLLGFLIVGWRKRTKEAR